MITSSGAISLLFHNIFKISLTSGVRLHIHLLNVVVRLIFSSILQIWYVEVRISRSISESPLDFEITRVDCISWSISTADCTMELGNDILFENTQNADILFENTQNANLLSPLYGIKALPTALVGCRLGKWSSTGLKTVSLNPYLPVIYANSADPDQTPRSVAADLGLHCLPMSQSRFYR